MCGGTTITAIRRLHVFADSAKRTLLQKNVAGGDSAHRRIFRLPVAWQKLSPALIHINGFGAVIAVDVADSVGKWPAVTRSVYGAYFAGLRSVPPPSGSNILCAEAPDW